MSRKAESLAALLPTLSRGRSKQTGQAFFVVPASDRLSAHWTAVDGSGCTCRSFAHRGACSHSLAVQIHEQRQQRPAPRPRPSYETLFPACKGGCGDIGDTRDGYCDRCASTRERQARHAV